MVVRASCRRLHVWHGLEAAAGVGEQQRGDGRAKHERQGKGTLALTATPTM